MEEFNVQLTLEDHCKWNMTILIFIYNYCER